MGSCSLSQALSNHILFQFFGARKDPIWIESSLGAFKLNLDYFWIHLNPGLRATQTHRSARFLSPPSLTDRWGPLASSLSPFPCSLVCDPAPPPSGCCPRPIVVCRSRRPTTRRPFSDPLSFPSSAWMRPGPPPSMSLVRAAIGAAMAAPLPISFPLQTPTARAPPSLTLWPRPNDARAPGPPHLIGIGPESHHPCRAILFRWADPTPLFIFNWSASLTSFTPHAARLCHCRRSSPERRRPRRNVIALPHPPPHRRPTPRWAASPSCLPGHLPSPSSCSRRRPRCTGAASEPWPAAPLRRRTRGHHTPGLGLERQPNTVRRFFDFQFLFNISKNSYKL
jgi:hypothetical protein